ncbi:MAG TPA: Gldg family protein [Spirochaetia bacterium]
MKKSTFLDSLKSRKFRFGGYATLLVLVVLAVVVIINVLVGQIPGKLDLTKNKLFSLSPGTYKIVDGLKSDVTITTLARAGQEDVTVKAILEKYASRNRHIKLQSIDPEMNPGWSKQYETAGQSLSQNSIVVANGQKFKTIGYYDMYNYDTSNYNPMNPNSQPQLTSISVEQRVTSALMYVTAAKNVTMYVLTGHGEETLQSVGLSTTVSDENYDVKQLNLLTEKAVPVDADLVLLLAPKTDISAEDADKLRAYLDNGGRAAIFVDLLAKDNSLPDLAGLLKSYGVEVRSVVVVEGDQNRIAGQNPLYVIPNLETHDILSPIKASNYPLVLVGAQAIQTLELKKRTLKIEPLLTSSAKSYGKRDINSARTAQRESGDLSGPFNLAVAITDPAADSSGKDTRLVVSGDVRFLAQSITAQVPANADFFMNSLGWLKGQKDSLTIRPKSVQTMRLDINNLEALALSGVVVILFPLLVLGAGFFVWMRRRHL